MKPLAPLSLDLDDKWSYLKTHGNPSWRELPTYLPTVVPRILSMLGEHGLRLTFFVVGQDAARPEHADTFGQIASGGHEIGNHSYLHEPWLRRYGQDEVRADLERAHQAITIATGFSPKGFRGPGFSLSALALLELRRLSYVYDATVFANILNPVGRAYYFFRSNLTRDERKERKELFGTFRGAFRPNVPFRWDLNQGDLLEVPVTTVPGLRVPFHFSYLLFLASKSESVAMTYFRSALGLCRLRRVSPSLLLHPLDFLGVEDAPELAFFPGMRVSYRRKIELTERFIVELMRHYRPIPILDYVDQLQDGYGTIPRLSPSFA